MVAMPTTTQEKLEAHARMLGEEVERVRAVRLNGFHMREAGTFVDIDLHGFSMFTVRATKLELGIRKDDMRGKYITGGSKRLIPEEYVKRLTNIDSRFRQSLLRHSFDVTGPYRWVPYTAYTDWKAEWEEIQSDLDVLKREVIENYPQIKARLVEIYTKIGMEAWDAIVGKQGGTPDNALDLGGGQVFENRQAFVDYIVNRVLKRLPTPEEIRNGIWATYHNARMLSMADVEADRLLQERFDADRAEEVARGAHAAEAAEAQRRLVWAEEEAQRHVIEEQERTQRRLVRAEAEERELEVQERQIKMQAMHDAEMEHARRWLQEMGHPMQEIFDQFRARLYEDVQAIRATLEEKGYLPGATATKAKGLQEAFALLNAHGDAEVDSALAKLSEIMERRVPNPKRGKNATTYDANAIAAQLKAIADLTHESAQAIARQAGSTRAGALML